MLGFYAVGDAAVADNRGMIDSEIEEIGALWTSGADNEDTERFLEERMRFIKHMRRKKKQGT